MAQNSPKNNNIDLKFPRVVLDHSDEVQSKKNFILIVRLEIQKLAFLGDPESHF